jgi:hypothetical protein
MNSEIPRWRHVFTLKTIFSHPLLKDSISRAGTIATFVLSGLTLAVLIVKLQRSDFPVPVHYSNLIGFDQTGNWIQTYRLAGFAFFVSFLNTFLAAKSFRRNRLVSFFLLLGAVVVSLFCLIIGLAFAEIS